MRFFLLIYFIFSVKHVDCCDSKVMTANTNSQRFLQYHVNDCEYTIESHPTKGIEILVDNYYEFKVWLQFQVDGVQQEIYVGLIKKAWSWSYAHYKTPKNVGMRIQVRDTYYDNIDFKINRIDDGVCGYPYVRIGVDETRVEYYRGELGEGQYCAYRLVPDESYKNFNEVFLNFHANIDYTMHKHQNGVIGEGESQSQSKLFPIGTYDLKFSKNYWIPGITARLVHISCDCGNTTFNEFPANNMISIQSPGFPNGNCPLEECIYKISSSQNMEVLLFNVEAQLAEKDFLKISDFTNTFIDYPVKGILPSFAVERRDFEIHFKSNAENFNRIFEINVTRIEIPEECRCSSYLEKFYTQSDRISFNIPKICENMFCYWHIQGYEEKRISIEMSMENANPNDVITCNDKKFFGPKLHQGLFHSTKNVPMNIEFRRINMSNNEDTRLNIQWAIREDCECSESIISLKTNVAKLLTTSTYPENYCSNSKCWQNITSPNGTFIELTIEMLNIENFHDFLKIYDKSGMIVELTGSLKNRVIVSSGNVLNILFESDADKNGKGYFIYATARENEGNDYGILIVIVLIILGIVILVGILKYTKTRRLSNSVVQFTNYFKGSSATINLDSI